MLRPRGPCDLEAKSFGLGLSLGLTLSGVSEQFLNGTSAHNRPFQCHDTLSGLGLDLGLMASGLGGSAS